MKKVFAALFAALLMTGCGAPSPTLNTSTLPQDVSSLSLPKMPIRYSEADWGTASQPEAELSKMVTRAYLADIEISRDIRKLLGKKPRLERELVMKMVVADHQAFKQLQQALANDSPSPSLKHVKDAIGLFNARLDDWKKAPAKDRSFEESSLASGFRDSLYNLAQIYCPEVIRQEILRDQRQK